ncbi:MAG TPA: hypothetical protein VKU00_02680 [Chthonomonadaceae bacterium]|nr:hypothetical protein [Chthonomonadaceae bacterium]
MASNHGMATSKDAETARSFASKGWKRVVAGAVALAGLAALCSGSVRVHANQQYIVGHDYLYNLPNDPVDVTSEIEVIGSNTYVQPSGGIMFQVTLDYDDGHIYDSSNDQIGFIYGY